MNKKLFTLLALMFALQAAATAQDLMTDVGEQLQTWLEKIPRGQEPNYGFESRSDFAAATAGSPYQVYTLDASFFSGAMQTNKNYLVPTGDWRIPILVRDKYALMATAVKKDNRWRIVDIGARVMAGELDAYRAVPAISNAKSLSMLRVYQLQCDFIFTGDPATPAGVALYPLQSARMNISALKDNGFEARILSDILPMIKERSK